MDRPRSPRTRPGHVILPQQDERRLDLRCTFTDNQDPHRRDLCQVILPILPLSSRHYRYRPQGQGRRPKDYRRVPDLGRRRDVLHRARRAIRRPRRRRRHSRPVLEEGFISNFMHPHPPDRDRVRRVTVCEIIAVIESAGKATLKAAEVDERQGGILVVDPKDVDTIHDAFEGC